MAWFTVTFGTNGDDVVIKGDGKDIIFTCSGDDLIMSGGGNDIIFAGSGDDTVYAGDGRDIVHAGSGDDTVYGENGDDKIYGGFGDDLLSGGDDDDFIFGGFGHDVIYGDDGHDFIFGGHGNDTLNGGSGSDFVLGGSGNDTFLHIMTENLGAHDVYKGGKGHDILCLELTEEQALRPDVQAAVTAFLTANKHKWFDFSDYAPDLGLKVKQIEELEVNPIAIDDSYNVDENAVLMVTLANSILNNDFDLDGDSLTILTSNVVSSQGVAISIMADGTFSYDTNDIAGIDMLAEGEILVDTFDYKITDGTYEESATVTITITGINDAPVAIDDVNATDEDTILNVAAPGVLMNDSDIDNGDTISVIAFDALSTFGALVTVFADGSYSYDSTSAAAIQALNDGEFLDDTFTYTIEDSYGATATATVTITVEGINDLEAIDDTALVKQFDFTPQEGNVLANDTGDPLTVTTTGVFNSFFGTLILNADGSYSYELNTTLSNVCDLMDGETIIDSFNYTMTDGVAVDSATLDITILGLEKLIGSLGSDFIFGSADDEILIGEFQAIDLTYRSGLPAPSNFSSDSLDTISGGDGMDYIVGDLNKLSVDIVSSGNIIVSNVTGTISQSLNNLAVAVELNQSPGTGNVINGDAGDDILIGNVAFFEHTIKTGNNLINDAVSIANSSNLTEKSDSLSQVSSVLGATPGSNFLLGDDTISGGVGNDLIYGDSVNFEISFVSGNNIDAGVAEATDTNPNPTNPFENILASANVSNGINWGNSVTTFGDDTLTGGEDNDVIVGDVGNWIQFYQSGRNLEGGTAVANDPFAGEVGGIVETNAQASAISEIQDVVRVTTFGNDTNMQGNLGNDELYGDVQNFEMTLIAGDDLTTGVATSITGGAIVRALNLATSKVSPVFQAYFFGDDDSMNGGAGNDRLVGDVGNISLHLEGGDDLTSIINIATNQDSHNVAIAYFAFSAFDFGNDDNMQGGTGDDILIGDVDSLMFELFGGNDVNGSDESLIGQFVEPNITGNRAYAMLRDVNFNFGSEMNMQGEEGSDIIYGDIKTLSMYLDGGDNANVGPDKFFATFNTANGEANIRESAFNFGNDVIYGDIMGGSADGINDNDTIYGDAESFSFTLVGGSIIVDDSGTGDVSASLSSSTSINLGDDQIFGQEGDDILVGDVDSILISLTQGTVIAGGGSGSALADARIDADLSFGDDLLDGGAGDDTLIGDGSNAEAARTAWLSAGSGTVSGGNDTLIGGLGTDNMTGGIGADTFMFNTLADSGIGVGQRDIITDFNQAESDNLDLSALSVTYIDTAAFSGGGSGELRYSQTATETIVEVDGNGDGLTDMEIELSGLITLINSDFIL